MKLERGSETDRVGRPHGPARDRSLLRFLFRRCSRSVLKPLSGLISRLKSGIAVSATAARDDRAAALLLIDAANEENVRVRQVVDHIMDVDLEAVAHQ